jgi:hypothetical protein
LPRTRSNFTETIPGAQPSETGDAGDTGDTGDTGEANG